MGGKKIKASFVPGFRSKQDLLQFLREDHKKNFSDIDFSAYQRMIHHLWREIQEGRAIVTKIEKTS